MLSRLQPQNFKSFDDCGLALAPLTLFVGANASGKSNVFDALRFLQGLGGDIQIGDVLRGRWEGGRETWPGIRGGSKEIARDPRKPFAISTTWIEGNDVLAHHVACKSEPDPMVVQEALLRGEKSALFSTHAASLGTSVGPSEGGAIRAALAGDGAGRSPTAEFTAFRSLLGQIRPLERVSVDALEGAKRTQARFRGQVFLSITPARMRSYVPRQATQLGAEGENISAVVRRLVETPGERQALVDWLSELCAPEISGVDFVETDLGDVMLVLVESDGARVSARSLSDGTLRFLGQLIALRTAPPGSLLLMEEIESGLHPKRINLLVEILESTAYERGVQVLATTHSPHALACATPRTLGDAIVFARTAESRGSIARRLRDLPNFDEIVAKRGIEHLFTTGWLERAL